MYDDDRGSMKHTDALVIAEVEGFEWDFEDAPPEALYDALENLGYYWADDRNAWLGPENPENPYY